VTLRDKPAVAILPGGSSNPDRSRGQKPDEEKCLEEGNSYRNSSNASSSDIGSSRWFMVVQRQV
jgi:hypothetical protein